MRRKHYAAFCDGVFVAEGPSPRAAFRAAETVLTKDYSPDMGVVQFEVVIHEATFEALLAVRSCVAAAASGQSDNLRIPVQLRPDGMLDVVEEAPGAPGACDCEAAPGAPQSSGSIH